MAFSWMEEKDFNKNVWPADDFFEYVNGGWVASNSIPEDEARWGAFSALRVEVEGQLKAIMEELAAESAAKPSAETAAIKQKVRDFYATAMDAEKCNRLGLAPIEPVVNEIDCSDGLSGISRAVARMHRAGVPALWAPIVDRDEKNTDVIAFHIYQSGLGLPDRDYYLNDDEKSRAIREKYVAYMESMLGAAGLDARVSHAIMEIETQLAKSSDTRVEMRDPERQYHKADIKELAALAPSFDWGSYFKEAGYPEPEYFIVGQPRFLHGLDGVLKNTPQEALKAYLKWHLLNGMAPVLTEELEKIRFDFYGSVFMGVAKMKERWRRVIGVMNSVLEDAVGQLYVERHFSAEAKERVNDLVDHLMSAYKARIEKLEWMGADTKEKALAKLAAVARKLGYPDKWKDTAELSIGTDSYAGNYMSACAFEFDRQMKKVGCPADNAEWRMLPQVVNACYDPTMNEITFPAAILQPPFFAADADDALNFGGIGSVIGHEFTHGFDDEGSKFDARGNLQSWWLPEDKRRFEEMSSRLVGQFNDFEVLPGLHANGKLTLGENIADLGGLCIAYDSLQIFLKEHPEKNVSAGGFTPEERFFIGWAIIERGSEREEYVRLATQVDPHSRSRDRINCPASNMDEFYKAFGVKSGDKLWRDPGNRVKIW